MRRVPYQDRPVRYEYRLTDKGRAFWDVLAAMWRWGEDWLFDGDNPLELVDREGGATIDPVVVDRATGEPLDVRRLKVRLRGDQPSPVATGRSGSLDQPDHDPT